MNIETIDNRLKVSGVQELSALNARELKAEVIKKFDEGIVSIDFDASELGFIDSSGLGALISLQKASSLRSGALRIISPSEQVQQIFELTRLHRFFEIVA